MSEIQVNTNDLHNGSQNLKSASSEIGNVQKQVSGAPSNIGNIYDGQLRQAIEGIVGGSSQTGARLQNRAGELGNELFSRANAFEAANQSTFSSLSNISSQLNGQFSDSSLTGFPPALRNSDQTKATTLFGIAGIMGLTGASLTTVLTGTTPTPVSAGTWSIGNINNSLDLLKDGMSMKGFKEIGRFFNKLKGSERGGFVGKMDKTGRFIKNSNYIKFGIIPIGLGTISDVIEGDNIVHATSSEIIEFGVGVLLCLNPYVGAFYLGTKIGMMVGGVVAMGLDAAGKHEAASSINGALDTLDYTDRLGDWAATKLGEAISDFIENPPVIIDSPISPTPPIQLA